MTGPRMWDISPAVTPKLAVFPGDTPPSREVLMDMKNGDALTLSTFRSTVHVGAHVDAPSHYGVDGRTIEQQPLDLYVGACRVIRVDVPRGDVITPDMLPDAIDEPRVLFATGSFPDPTSWNDDFVAFEPACIHALADRGVRLVGIDTPSVDRATSKDLPSHAAVLARDMAILEGIVLTDISAGPYELIALPLHLPGFDASPVRAVLRTARD